MRIHSAQRPIGCYTNSFNDDFVLTTFKVIFLACLAFLPGGEAYSMGQRLHADSSGSDAQAAATIYKQQVFMLPHETNPGVRVIDMGGMHSYPEDDCIVFHPEALVAQDLIVECARITLTGKMIINGTAMFVARKGRELPSCSYGSVYEAECVRPAPALFFPPPRSERAWMGDYAEFLNGLIARSYLSKSGDVVVTTHAIMRTKSVYVVALEGDFLHMGDIQAKQSAKVMALNHISNEASVFLRQEELGHSVEVLSEAAKTMILGNQFLDSVKYSSDQVLIDRCGVHRYPKDICLIGPKIKGLWKYPYIEPLLEEEDHLVCDQLDLECHQVLVFGKVRVSHLKVKLVPQKTNLTHYPCPIGVEFDEGCYVVDPEKPYWQFYMWNDKERPFVIGRKARLTVEHAFDGLKEIPKIVSEGGKLVVGRALSSLIEGKIEVRDFIQEAKKGIREGNEEFKRKIRELFP